MNSTTSIFNEVVDCAYGEAICYDMSGYYCTRLFDKLKALCANLEKKFPFATFNGGSMDFCCEFCIKVEAKPDKKLTPKRIDKICECLPHMKLSHFDKYEALFAFDDEGYFENNFINNNHHDVTGKNLVKKYGLKVVE